MYCVNCGTQLPDNANFCSNCGTQLKATGSAWGTPYSAAPAYPAAQPYQAGDKFLYDVILVSPGAKKIDVIRVIRELTRLGLKEAKDMTDIPNSPVLSGVSKTEADLAKIRLENVGATVRLA